MSGRDEPPKGGRGDSQLSGEYIAFLLLAGLALGGGLGYLIDWLAGTRPLFLVIGVFAGFGLALYALYLETRGP